MNNFNITGRLTKEPELRYTKENKAVMSIDIAINNGKDDTTFLAIAVFNKQAETISQYCHKGDMLGITGTIRNHNWEDKNGNKHYDYSFMANRVDFLSSKSNSSSETKKAENEPKKEPVDNTQIYADFGDSIEISDEEICF